MQEGFFYEIRRRYRDADTWTVTDQSGHNLSWLYRGYTGHEMLSEVNIINMNGRLYDPLVARMLSVDNYAGLDGTSQSYNRYTYANNNPLVYTDPSGETPLSFIGNIALGTGGPLTIGQIGQGLNIINTLASGNQLLNGNSPSDIIIVGNKNFRNRVQMEMFNLAASSMEGFNLISDALDPLNDFVILQRTGQNVVTYEGDNSRGGKIIHWELDFNILERESCDLNGDCTTGTGHEFQHNADLSDPNYKEKHKEGYGYIANSGDGLISTSEPSAVAGENNIRAAIGYSIRTHYGDVEMHGYEVDWNSYHYDENNHLWWHMKKVPNFKCNYSAPI